MHFVFFVLFCLGTEVSMGVGRQYILYYVCDEHLRTPTPYSVSLMPHLALAPISVSNENCERPGSETNGWSINDIIMTMRMVNIG